VWRTELLGSKLEGRVDVLVVFTVLQCNVLSGGVHGTAL
jgi:hypothetical protein